MIEYMSKTGQIPEMILVYISNTNRTRDFTPTKTNINYEGEDDKSLEQSGGGKSFLRFLNTELIPHVEKKFRTNSFNAIVGRSFGGLIAAYDYLQKESKIDRYLLIDPSLWWNEQFVIKEINNTLLSAVEDRKIYIACSDNFKYSNYIKEMRNSQELFYTNLKKDGVSNSNIKIEYFEEYTHGTVTIPSLHKGLLFIFNNFYLNGMKYKKADEIIYHFSKFSEDNKAKFPPLEGMINWLASTQKGKDQMGAIKLYQLNTTNYPESLNAHFNLAEHYEKLDMTNKAIEKYKDILKIDVGNKKAREKITELEK
jgi:predicted alpha/beta superfamily hydrolase